MNFVEKHKTSLIVSAVCIFVLIFGLLFGAVLLNSRKTKAYSNETESAALSESRTETESTALESDTEENTPSLSDSETDLPEETEPVTEPEPQGVTGSLDSADIEYLMSLDNTCRGWGQGVNFDEKNRPGGAVFAQNTYGIYGTRYIMDDENKIYLTFDEGYENGYTSAILDVLKDKNVKAVFFVTLPYVKSCPELVKRMIDEGHAVGNHSSAHLSFPSMSLEDACNDVMTLHNYVLDNFGYEMKFFRFPMGESSDRTKELLHKMGYTSLFWSYAYKDWDPSDQMSASDALLKLTERAHPGALYLLHAVSSTNAEILGEAVDSLRDMGYELCLP